MRKITTFKNKSLLDLIEARINTAIKEVGEDLGIDIKTTGNGSYSDTNFTLKVECSLKSDDGVVVTTERSNFIKYGAMYGFKKEDIDKIFKYQGKNYKITGLKSRRQKNPIVCTQIENNMLYKFPTSIVKDNLEV